MIGSSLAVYVRWTVSRGEWEESGMFWIVLRILRSAMDLATAFPAARDWAHPVVALRRPFFGSLCQEVPKELVRVLTVVPFSRAHTVALPRCVGVYELIRAEMLGVLFLEGVRCSSGWVQSRSRGDTAAGRYWSGVWFLAPCGGYLSLCALLRQKSGVV